jgi:hypothetical protein
VRVLAIEHARQAPVHHVDLAEAPHHDVGGLEIAVDHALVVGVGHGFADLEHHSEHARLAPALAFLIQERQDLAQAPPLDQLHREVEASRGVEAELVDRDDAGMVELAGDLGLLEEASEASRGGGSDASGPVDSGRERDLHGEVPAQVLVEDAQDGALSAAGELALRPVAREAAAAIAKALHELGAEFGTARGRFAGG